MTLTGYLLAYEGPTLTLSLDALEAHVGPLPSGARTDPAWWTRHDWPVVAWSAAGWEAAAVNLQAGIVILRRRTISVMRAQARPFPPSPRPAPRCLILAPALQSS